jgi:phosphoglycerate kinase
MLRKGIADEVWATGGVANLLIELSGNDIGSINHKFLVKELGKSYHSTVETAKALLNDFADKINLPTDLAANVEDNRVDLRVEDLPIDAPLYDMGINSIMRLSSAIKKAGTIILNGPAGVFEVEDFALGTIEMLNACAESKGYVVVGGGHTATLIMNRGLADKMGHVSTGGGACLDYLAGRILPGIASLEVSADKFFMDVTKTVNSND